MERTSFLFAVVLMIMCLTLGLALQIQNLTTDESALLDFKSYITSDPIKILANWSSNASVCNWKGVSCNANQRVMALNLSGSRLEGTIAPHLGNLTFLTSLDLSFNNFSGFIPSELVSLRGLKQMILANNKLTGTIPSGIFNMSFLQVFNLTENGLSGSLPLDICNHLSNLRGLFLSFNYFEESIPSDLYKCRGLEYLSLSFNKFGGKIPKELGYLTNLKDLTIGGNFFTGGIPLEIGNLTKLNRLDMQSSFLTGVIPSSIFSISSLRIINFSNNSLSGSLPVGMHFNLPVLEELRLAENNLAGQIPSFIWECKTLEVLHLSTNNFTGGIPKRVGNLTSLKALVLNENHFTGEVPVEIGRIRNLGNIFLSYNDLYGSVPSGIFNMSSLLVLALDSNNFTGPLPSSMWTTLTSIEKVYASNNNFGGMIPSSIGNATKLNLLSMLSTSLTGSIPVTIGNLRSLRRLYLGGNNLTRESSTAELRFITSLTNCRQLEAVELSLNQFNGFLPGSFGNFSSSLQTFNIFNSKLIGTIPSEIGKLSSLQSINMDSNGLTGFIPTTLGKMKRLDRIYLEHNRVQGSIPTELCELTNLGDLYLDDNMLSGPIPDCLGELTSLRRVYLQSNNLSSTIPLNLWNLKDLLELNLSSNSISGHLPLEIQNLKVITKLDLSWNHLSGGLPNTLGSAQSLVSLSLAGNQFHGSIPQSFGSLISLESLDLSENNFSGIIPKSLENLEFLKYFNVSFNNLEGEVPRGGSFANFTSQSFMQNSALCGSSSLNFPPCKTKALGVSRSKLMMYILLPIASAILISVFITYFWIRRKKREKRHRPSSEITLPFGWRKVSYHELLKATDSFSENNLLGTGSFGSVYKATFADGSINAVKVFHMQSETANKSFDAECEVLGTIRHRNLVRIISCCSNPEFKALVLDYMPNGSLEMWLHSGIYQMDMQQRLKVAEDVASALEYLHHDHAPAVVHCDLKPSNILMDGDMGARLCDFSISKLFDDGESVVQTKTLATVGYMAPDEILYLNIEYGTEGIVSTSGDVYSYGVVLLEMFTKRKPTDAIFGEELDLKRWVSESIRKNSITEVVDSSLIRREDEDFSAKEVCLLSLLRLAVDCLTNSPQERSNMRDIVARLQRIKSLLLKGI